MPSVIRFSSIARPKPLSSCLWLLGSFPHQHHQECQQEWWRRIHLSPHQFPNPWSACRKEGWYCMFNSFIRLVLNNWPSQPFEDPDATFIQSVTFHSVDGHHFDRKPPVPIELSFWPKQRNHRQMHFPDSYRHTQHTNMLPLSWRDALRKITIELGTGPLRGCSRARTSGHCPAVSAYMAVKDEEELVCNIRISAHAH